NGIDADHYLDQRVRRSDSPELRQDRAIPCRDRPQQASPRKMDVYLVSYSVKFLRQVLDRRLNEQYVREPALSRLPSRLHRRLFEQLDVRVDADEELFRMLTRHRGNKPAVSRPDVDHDPAFGKGQ